MGLPVEVNNLMMGAVGGYQISRSLRFRSSASANLTRTPSSAGNRKTWTWSGWVKRGTFGTDQWFLRANSTGSDFFLLGFAAANQFYSSFTAGVSAAGENYTTAVFRDPSAWYHCVCAFDSTQATASNRVKLYVNGVQQTLSVSNAPTLNADYQVNSTNLHYIGGFSANYADFYLADVYLIDGQALTPSSFGETDAITGVWNPKKYSGTYGTNGFYLNFSDNSAATATTIGKDYSGNGNNWTPNNISVTAGTTYDSMIDSPTPYADGDNGRGNYAVMNPNFVTPSTTFSNGNLTLTKTGNTDVVATSTIAIPSSKWYWEITITSLSASSNLAIGIVKNTTTNGSWVSGLPAGVWFNSGGGVFRYGSNVTGTLGTTFATNDVIGLALDMDAGTLALYKNNTLIYTVSSVDTTTPHYAFWDSYANGESAAFNFGQRPFSYTPPSGYKALNTYNLPAASISNGAKHFGVNLYTGTGATQSIVNSGSFQPDLIWGKQRNGASSNVLTDSVRGTNSQLSSNLTNAQDTATDVVTAFNSNGFTVGASAGFNMNQSGSTLVAWQWKGGGTAVTNNSGTISSQVSANTSAGFSIVTYTGNGTAGATVGHGLGVAPNFVIWKKRSSTANWFVWSKAADVAAGSTRWGYLNATNAFSTSASTNEYPTYKVDPTSTVLTLNGSGSSNGTNDSSATYVAYCFSAVSGFSAMGSWTGNSSSDGPFVFTNFRPRFVMWKNASFGSQWILFDTSRSTYNISNGYLEPNTSDTENTASAPSGVLDILSNGFKLRTAGIDYNDSSYTYVYAAFAENPFTLSRAR